jgi:hypothetical protein
MTISFIVGTGRSGTLSIASILARAKNSFILHEGMQCPISDHDLFSLPALYLENLQVYLKPSLAKEILENRRLYYLIKIAKLYRSINKFCEVAFFLAPFVESIKQVFPTSKLAIIVRDGRHFVRSATTNEIYDSKPIGYGPSDKYYRKEKKEIVLGRLKPGKNSIYYKKWKNFTALQKNSWLWAETYRIILKGLSNWPESDYKIFLFEDIFSNIRGFRKLLDFIGLNDIDNCIINDIMAKKMNERKNKSFPHPRDWTTPMRAQFDEFASDIMIKFGYY